MESIKIKPLSVNEVWQGRRFKTTAYKSYEQSVLFLLPKITLPDPPYNIELTFGLSNMASDFDNPVKPFVDILQKKYGFNDKLIMKAVINKVMCKKGQEFISFNLSTYVNK